MAVVQVAHLRLVTAIPAFTLNRNACTHALANATGFRHMHAIKLVLVGHFLRMHTLVTVPAQAQSHESYAQESSSASSLACSSASTLERRII